VIKKKLYICAWQDWTETTMTDLDSEPTHFVNTLHLAYAKFRLELPDRALARP
jgi:hypothetical protein